MQSYFNQLLDSYSKLKKRELKFRTNIYEEQVNTLSPEILAKEGSLIQLISSIAPGQSVDVPGVDPKGEKKVVTIGRKMSKTGTEMAVSIGAYNPAGRNSTYGDFIGGSFNPSKPPTSRNEWGKLLIFYGRDKSDKEKGAEQEEELQNINISDAYVTPKLLTALGSLKQTFGDMWDKGLFSWVLKNKYEDEKEAAWNGASRAKIESYIYSNVPASEERVSLSYKIQQSIGYKLEPVEGTENLALVQTPIIDPELVGSCLEQFDFVAKTAAQFLHPDTTEKVQKEDLVKVQNLIALDRDIGIILVRTEGAGESIIFPVRASRIWEDFVDNYNLALDERGLSQFKIKEKTLDKPKNLNDIRGTGTEKVLSILSLIKNKNLKEASLSMQELYGEYGMALFEAFSVFESYKEEGLIDADDSDLVTLSEDLSKLFDLQDCSHEEHTDAYRKTPCIQKNVFEAFKGIITESARAYRDILFIMNPDAITHVGGKVGTGKKADNRAHYKTAKEAQIALKRMGVSETDINKFKLFDRKKGETFTPDEIEKYRADPEETTAYINISLKNYLEEGPTNMGHTSTQNILGLLSEVKAPPTMIKFTNYLAQGIGLDPSEKKSVTNIAKELEKSMSLFKGTLENGDKGPETRRTIVAFMENNAGGYESTIKHEVLGLLKGLKFDDSAQASHSMMKVKKAIYHAQLSKMLKTNKAAATNFLLMKSALGSCAFGETITSMKFLKTKSSVSLLNNKTIFSIAKKVRKGTYKIEPTAGGSFRIFNPNKPQETVLAIKSDRRKKQETNAKGEEFMDYFASWQFHLGNEEAKRNSITPVKGISENSKLVQEYIKAQEALFESLFAKLG